MAQRLRNGPLAAVHIPFTKHESNFSLTSKQREEVFNGERLSMTVTGLG